MTDWKYPIALYDKQRQAVQSKADEILFGGSLAGGKTEMILKHMVDICLLIPHAKTLIIRKNFPQMVEIEQRLRKRIPSIVAEQNKSEHVFRFYNGAELHLGFLGSEEDAERYQGHEYVKIGFDELTHYDKSWVAAVVSRIRADATTQKLMESKGLTMGMLAASNPGSRGHSWVKQTFIDPHPSGEEFVGDDGVRRIFIRSSLWDNPHIDHKAYLRRLGGYSPEKKRAMIYGDWNILEGVRFTSFRLNPSYDDEGNETHPGHVIKPHELPIDFVDMPRAIGVDFGTNDPMACIWLARVGRHIVVYRELQEKELTSTQQAQMIMDSEIPGERTPGHIPTLALDPAAWRRNTEVVGPKLGGHEAPLGSIAYHYKKTIKGPVVKAVNPRIAGWAEVDELLTIQDDGLPGLLIYDTCTTLISAIQSAPRAKNNWDDVDTNWPEDHILDALRYGIMEILGKSRSVAPTDHEMYKQQMAMSTTTGGLSVDSF